MASIYRNQVSVSMVGTLSRATEKIADQMAQEILKDPVFRAQMRELVQRAFAHALDGLSQPPSAPEKGGQQS